MEQYVGFDVSLKKVAIHVVDGLSKIVSEGKEALAPRSDCGLRRD